MFHEREGCVSGAQAAVQLLRRAGGVCYQELVVRSGDLKEKEEFCPAVTA